MDEMMHAMQAVFEETKVPYVLIGGIAASLLGRPRMTMASDVVVVLSAEEIRDDRVVENLNALNLEP